MLNAEDFYQEFLDALRYLGIRWGFKQAVTVELSEGKLILRFEKRTAEIDFNKSKTF